MSKDNKDTDYQNRYYSNKRNNPYKFQGSRPGKKDKYEARIIGSEYKIKKKKRKSGISRVILIMFFVLFVFFMGFFIFYTIDNDLFGKKESTVEKTESNVFKNSSNALKENSAGSLQITNTDKSNAEGSQTSFGQKIINFFIKATGRAINEENYPDALDVNIYFSMLGNEIKFGSESRTIAAGNTQMAVTNIINELLKGPYKEYNFAVIPPGTRLLDVKIINDIAQINLSQEFLSNSLDSGVLDEYIIYTIVDTVTEIAEIRAVTFCIDGKEIKEYGNVDLRIPAIRNEKYLDSK